MKIRTIELIREKLTYPSWTTSRTYTLKAENLDDIFLNVYYIVGSTIKKKVHRVFPKEIDITSRFAFVLGLISGEGANKLGKSNYRRFTFTNKNPQLIKLVLEELDKNRLLMIKDLPERSFHIIHSKKSQNEVIQFWSKALDLNENKFCCVSSQPLNSDFGVCHIYLSDVLLRRVIDLLKDLVTNEVCA